MPLLQTISQSLRSMLGNDSRIAAAVRPAYARMLSALYERRGLKWSINGEPFRIDPKFRANLASDYDHETAAALARQVRAGDVCLDVGANLGVYALQFARWVGSAGKVFAFEPNPQTRAALQRHIALNRFDRPRELIEVVPLAVTDAPGEVSFTACGVDGMSRVGQANPRLLGSVDLHEIRVKSTTIDQFCDERRIDPNWLFLDIEGFEVAALRGARETIRRRGRDLRIAMELHPSLWEASGTSQTQLNRLLAEIGRHPVDADGRPTTLDRHEIVFLEPAS